MSHSAQPPCRLPTDLAVANWLQRPRRAFALLAGSPTGGGHKQMVVHPKNAGTLCASGAGMSRPAGMASETDFVVVTRPDERQVVVSPKVSGTLYAREAQPAGVSSEHNFLVITREEQEDNPVNWVVRRFTPLECERLQGFPDHWTDVPYKGKVVKDGPRYKAIGNSMPCPVMAFIGYQLHGEIRAAEFAERWLLIEEIRRKRGRPPVDGVSAMSDAERQRRRRERLRQAESPQEGT